MAEIVDTSDMFTAAIESLSRQDEYIPVSECKLLNQIIEGVMSMHQAFVSSHFLPDIDDVKSLLPLNVKRDISAVPSFPQIKGRDNGGRGGESGNSSQN